ncbi:MAG: hypothetical protein QOF51_4275 [Chloroflexota bacterium]|jgi:hypothetical protein|nr:hypothetical protein [Chloroflexota bacterium]
MPKRGIRLSMLANLALRGLMVYFGIEALKVTTTNSSDPRFAGKAIALRNALLMCSFTLLIPGLHMKNGRRDDFPWVSDALLLSIPTVDMAGNSFNLYNRYAVFDSVAHFYGNVAGAWIVALGMIGRAREPDFMRLLLVISTSTFLHVLLEVQEYWTDVFFGTRNVEGLEDTEGDILSGIFGTLTGVALAEILTRGRFAKPLRDEARRLALAVDPTDMTDVVTPIQLTPSPALYLVDEAKAAISAPPVFPDEEETEPALS